MYEWLCMGGGVLNVCSSGLDWVIAGRYVEYILRSVRVMLRAGVCVINIYICGVDEGCHRAEWLLVVVCNILMSVAYGGYVGKSS